MIKLSKACLKNSKQILEFGQKVVTKMFLMYQLIITSQVELPDIRGLFTAEFFYFYDL